MGDAGITTNTVARWARLSFPTALRCMRCGRLHAAEDLRLDETRVMCPTCPGCRKRIDDWDARVRFARPGNIPEAFPV